MSSSTPPLSPRGDTAESTTASTTASSTTAAMTTASTTTATTATSNTAATTATSNTAETTEASTNVATTATSNTAETTEASTNVATTEASSSGSKTGPAASENVGLPTMSSSTPPPLGATASSTTAATTASSTTSETTACSITAAMTEASATAETTEASTNVASTETSSSGSKGEPDASENVGLPTMSSSTPPAPVAGAVSTTAPTNKGKGPSESKTERLSTVSFSTPTPGASGSGTKGESYKRKSVRHPAMSSSQQPRPSATAASTATAAATAASTATAAAAAASTATATTKEASSGSKEEPSASKNVRPPVMSSSKPPRPPRPGPTPASTTAATTKATSSGSKSGPSSTTALTSAATSRGTNSRSRAGPIRRRIERISVEVMKGINDLEKVVLRQGRGSSAEVYLYGAQVMSWKNDQGEELLFVSKKAIFKPPKPIRGGIPLCFPQVSSYGPFERDGFARSRFWSIDPNPPPLPRASSTGAFVDLILKPTEEDMRTWPHSYEFRLRVRLSPAGDLLLTSRIRNTNKDGKPFSFAFAYHPYFSVSDIGEVRVEGLETQWYLDNLKNRERFTDQGDSITFESEIDKVYVEVPNKILVMDHEKRTTYVIRTDGLPDAVVWNPWDKKAKAMADFGNDEYQRMLSVATGVVEKTITLKPGQEWKARQELSFVRSSYYDGPRDPRKARGGR